MKRENIIAIPEILENYGSYRCNVKDEMDKLKISVSKMRKLTGLNHEIVKKYYEDSIQRIDKDVLSKITYVISIYGGDITNLIKYIPPKIDLINKNSK